MTSANLAGWLILGLLLLGFYVAVAKAIGWWGSLLLFIGVACGTALLMYATHLIES